MAGCRAVSWMQLICLSSVLCKGVLSLDHVPMLLWSTHRSFQGLAATLHEGHVISKHELHALLKQALASPDPRNVALFLQDALSVDDFTRYAGSSGNETPFRNVQELLKTSSSSLVLPAVDCHAVNHLSGYLQETLNWALVNVDSKVTSQLMVNGSKPNVFVIKLPLTSRTNDLSTRKELLENDKIIGEFTKSLQQQGIESVAIYTARRPSKVPVGPDVAWQSRRHLMSVGNQDTNLYAPINVTNGTGPNATCILFYATDLNFTVDGTVMNLTHRTFESHEVDTSNSVCSETNATLSLKYTNPVKGIESLEISFLMTKKYYVGSAREWFTLDFVHIQQDNKETAIFTAPSISGPAEYSFHCQLVGTSNHYGATLTPYNDTAKKWEVVISDFQIQAYNVEGHKFSYASDCTTFFTPGIWMGLVTSLVLLLILTFGIHMIVNLTTNNRFDDPKDQPLSVPQGE